MKTYVMKNVLTNYTSGMIVVKARNHEHAWEVLKEHCEKEYMDHIPTQARQENGIWEELESVAYVYGGG